ncbi:MAG TPA: hypothetical protein VL400_03810 [Polyangiaceae bacterium]|jgi:hypothetical protein|nr:hypothetical protein [Polyangiaceae bacterium]
MESRFYRVVVSSALVALAGPTACGGLAKSRECTKVIETMNAAATRAPAAEVPDPLAADIADLQSWDDAIGKIELSDAGLKKHVDDYRDLMKSEIENRRAQQKLEKVGGAPEQPVDPVAIQAEYERLGAKDEENRVKEQEIVAAINAYCERE